MKKITRELTNRNSFDVIKNLFSSEAFEQINCPLCSSKNRKKIFTDYYPRLVRCLSCQLIYTNPRLKNNYLKQLYSKEYYQNQISSILGYHDYLKDEVNLRKTFLKRLKQIENYKQPPGKLLDLGCATGFFMDEAQKRGWSPTGVEISDYAANFARKQLKLKVIVSDLGQIDLPKEEYDLISLWDVIEHLSNPLSVLKKIRASLKKDGLLVFATPDVESLPSKIARHRWIGYKLSDEHLTYFSSKTIALICKKSGLKVIKQHHIGKYVSYNLFIDRLGFYSSALGKILKITNKLIPKNTNFYLSAFDIICVYAKKI